MGDEHAPVDEVQKRGQRFHQPRLVRHHGVGNARQANDVPGNLPARVDQIVPGIHHFAGANLNGGQFRNPVLGGTPARGLDIDDGEGGIGKIRRGEQTSGLIRTDGVALAAPGAFLKERLQDIERCRSFHLLEVQGIAEILKCG